MVRSEYTLIPIVMETWTDLYLRAFADAKRLREAGGHRAAINRAYYTLYYCITARVAHRAPFNKYGWSNPEHSQMSGLVAHVSGLSAVEKGELRMLVKSLYLDRVGADYNPKASVGRDETREAFVDLTTALAILKEKV